MKLGRLDPFVAFAFTVMADPVSSVADAVAGGRPAGLSEDIG